MLNLVVIKTSDPDELVKTYKAFGLTFDYHRHGNGPMHYANETNGITLEIYPLPKNKTEPDNTLRLGFKIKDLDSKIKNLEKLGIKIISTPAQTEWGYSAIIADQDGRKIELTQE